MVDKRKSPDDMREVADSAAPSADDPSEFFALDETEFDITATRHGGSVGQT